MTDNSGAPGGAQADGDAAVSVTEHLWIAMPDGVRLAARMWRPDCAATRPVPAILEYIPYRKADMVRARDERNHPYLAAHGYACLRVDMRGSGDSEGQMDDMYGDAELDDARHVIDWIAAQPWCDGRVGMFGTSWGGTAALQANIDAPESLKAVIAVCATHDRYEDDIHHMGGCLLTDTLEWGATLPAILAAPPTSAMGPDWKEKWRARLDTLSFPVEAWVREEARGAYWRHGSVGHIAERLSRPILAVGGWSDRYSNSVMSLVSLRPDLVWGVVGPWGHHYPDQGHPGPAMGFQALALDWWDRWLKPERKGGADWPRLRAWLRAFDPPVDAIETRAGRWIETDAPAKCTAPRLWHVSRDGLRDGAPGDGQTWQVPFDLNTGRAAGDTGYFGRFGGLPLDQAEDDAASLCFETAPLAEDVILYGAAAMKLRVQTTAERQQLSLRLNDVAPDGQVGRVTFALRNMALNADLDAPDGPMGPRQEIDVAFPTAAYRFASGHRIRIAIGASCWPVAWPPPGAEPPVIEAGVLTLPLMRAEPDGLSHPLPEAQDLPVVKSHRVTQAARLRRFEVEDGEERVIGWEQPYTEITYDETETAFGYETRAEHRIRHGAPSSARSEIRHRATYARKDGTAKIGSTISVRSTAEAYEIEGKLTVDWEGERLAEKAWDVAIPRRFS